ncbi:hypothetical protein KD33_17375 [Clostridium sp. NCR]|nr:hypothetical protein KD33_17375 [Clostridium sp. NCR]
MSINRKKLILSIIIGLLIFSLINKKINKPENLEAFSESFIVPEFYRILDIDKWEEKKPPMNYTQLETSKIKINCKNKKDIEDITNVLNNHTLTPIEKSVFDQYWDNIYNTDRFWLYIFMDANKQKIGCYPANIIIENNLTFYVDAFNQSTGKSIYLKGTMTQSEFDLVEKIYKKEENLKSE